jgi:hypothetical protein
MYTSANRSSAPGTPAAHECDHGFCTVCGTVWPCSWARRHPMPVPVALPISRLPTHWS